MKVIGKMINQMEEVFKYILMDLDIKDILLMDSKKMIVLHTNGAMGKFIKVHLKMDIWKVMVDYI
jgi:hypothetical protein